MVRHDDDEMERGTDLPRAEASDGNGVAGPAKERLKHWLRSWYSTLSEYRVWGNHQIEGAIVATLTIPRGADVLAGQPSVALGFGLMLIVLRVTPAVCDLSRRFEYLDEMSPRIEGFLKAGTLITGTIAVVGFDSATVELVVMMFIVWLVMWLIAMWSTAICGMLQKPTL